MQTFRPRITLDGEMPSPITHLQCRAWNQANRAGADENPKADAVFALSAPLPVLPKIARKDPDSRQEQVLGRLSEMRSERTDPGERTVSAQSMKWARIRQGCKAPASVVLAPQSIKHSETPRI
jgi:hypothetical protein